MSFLHVPPPSPPPSPWMKPYSYLFYHFIILWAALYLLTGHEKHPSIKSSTYEKSTLCSQQAE